MRRRPDQPREWGQVVARNASPGQSEEDKSFYITLLHRSIVQQYTQWMQENIVIMIPVPAYLVPNMDQQNESAKILAKMAGY